ILTARLLLHPLRGSSLPEGANRAALLTTRGKEIRLRRRISTLRVDEIALRAMKSAALRRVTVTKRKSGGR
ncbi:MAG: hypothetical protein IJR89_06770, partial [Clostridia bacterium]|nr:hypothetical protein [Clostridia bacterium]